MSLVIRLSKIGKRGESRYKVVVCEKRSRRDGRPIAILGNYEKGIKSVIKNFDKKAIDEWVLKGAQLSEGVKKLI